MMFETVRGTDRQTMNRIPGVLRKESECCDPYIVENRGHKKVAI
jgi:hypothetical protein